MNRICHGDYTKGEISFNRMLKSSKIIIMLDIMTYLHNCSYDARVTQILYLQLEMSV